MRQQDDESEVLAAYSVRRHGCFEIVGPDGDVVAWVMTERMAVVLVSLMNLAHEAGLIDEE